MIRPQIQKVLDDLEKGEGWKFLDILEITATKGNVKLTDYSMSINDELVDLQADESNLLKLLFQRKIKEKFTKTQSDLLDQIKLD